MKATLIAWSFDETSGFGAARYAGNLADELERQGADIERIDSGGYTSVPWDPGWRVTAHFTMRSLSRIPSSGIYQFTMDRPSYSIPFLRTAFGVRSVVSILDTRLRLPGDSGVRPLRSGCLRCAVKEADMLIATSSTIESDLIGIFGADPSRVVSIPLGAGERFIPKTRERGDGPFTIGYLGRFELHNDVSFLIKAFSLFVAGSRMPARLVLFGTGPYLEDCMRLVKDLKLDSVEFRGFVPDDRLVDAYGSMDAFVFPSMVEGFGLPIVEAQRCGIPVIVRKDSMIPEEVTRFCLKARDESHAADLLASILDGNWHPHPDMPRYLERFTWREAAKRTLEVYERL